jgi:DNA polymerase III subunit gamma/tau
VAYQSLYRKYRPQRFSELVGQTPVTTALRNAVRDHRVGHAYLFSGPRGTGKTTTARLLAKALNCTHPDGLGVDGDPCGVCESCVAIAEGSSLDVIEVDAASKSRVEEMRDLLERVAYLSAGGAKKVYILDEVHMLSASAEAALLKTLEESPEHVVFVLATTDPLKVAPTIRSRTQHFEFGLYTIDEIQTHLADVCAKERVTADPDALAIIARAGAGSMRDALSFLDQAIAHGALDVEEVGTLLGGTAFDGRLRILEAVADESVADALVALGTLLEGGNEPRRLTEDLLATTRDAFLLVSAHGRVRVDVPDDDAERLRALAERLESGALVRMLETLGAAVVDMRGTDAADPRLVLEIALVRLARHEAGPPLQALTERVERLERATRDSSAAVVPSPAAARPSGGAEPAPGRTGRSFAELRRERGPSADDPAPGAEASNEAAVTGQPVGMEIRGPIPEAPEPTAAVSVSVDIDDVIVAWAEILPELPPATRAAVREAQPLAVDGDVITFGVPRQHYDVALPRFRKEADNIRDALSAKLGQRMKFKPIAHDGFNAPANAGPPGAPTEPVDPLGEPPVDLDGDEALDLHDLVNAEPDAAAVDSVSLLTRSFDATVVEEVPRD